MHLQELIDCRVYGTWDEGVDGPETTYAAKLAGRWNGWAVPLFTREEADRVVADTIRTFGDVNDPNRDVYATVLAWDGDTIVATYAAGTEDENVQRIEPDSDGLYDLSLGWCWETVDDDGVHPDEQLATPSLPQLEAFNRIRREYGTRVWAETRTVNADGSHVFGVFTPTGEKDGPVTITEQTATITIDRAGNVTVERT